MREPAAVFSPLKKSSDLKYETHVHEKAKGTTETRRGSVISVTALFRTLFADRHTRPVTGELSLAVRSFSETAVHFMLIAQSIIRHIYPCPCDMSPAILCLVPPQNKSPR